MQQGNPPPHWAHPPQHAQYPSQFPPSPYVHHKPAFQRWVERYWMAFALAGIPLLIGGMILKSKAEERANYVLVDSPDINVTVKIDGVEVPPTFGPACTGPKAPGLSGGRRPLVADMKPGKHKLEIVDETNTVIETADIDIPEAGYRAVYTVGKPRRYTFVSVAYGGELKGPAEVPLTPGPSPHLSILPSELKTHEIDFASINRVFPASIRTKSSKDVVRGLCTLTDDDDTECQFEEKKENKKRR